MKTFLLSFFICFSFFSNSIAQSSDYQYVIVPIKFDFLNEENKYQMNILSRVLLQDSGFKVFMDVEDRPENVQKNPCLALNFDLNELDFFLKKELQFVLKDCSGAIVYKSTVGESKLKNPKLAYNESLKKTFLGFFKNEIKASPDEYTLSGASPSKKSISKPKHSIDVIASYANSNSVYDLIKSGNGFHLLLASTETKFAVLEPADKGTYIFSSEDVYGGAYFTAEGNLIVEYRLDNSEDVQELIFEKL